MFRTVKLGMEFYATEIENLEDDLENIEQFVSEGSFVLLTETLEDAQKLFDKEITLVEVEE